MMLDLLVYFLLHGLFHLWHCQLRQHTPLILIISKNYLAWFYSTPHSTSFVNAILDSIIIINHFSSFIFLAIENHQWHYQNTVIHSFLISTYRYGYVSNQCVEMLSHFFAQYIYVSSAPCFNLALVNLDIFAIFSPPTGTYLLLNAFSHPFLTCFVTTASSILISFITHHVSMHTISTSYSSMPLLSWCYQQKRGPSIFACCWFIDFVNVEK